LEKNKYGIALLIATLQFARALQRLVSGEQAEYCIARVWAGDQHKENQSIGDLNCSPPLFRPSDPALWHNTTISNSTVQNPVRLSSLILNESDSQ